MENTCFSEVRTKSVFGELKLLSKNSFDIEVELMLLNGKKNRNNWIYKNLSEHLPEFLNTPILISYKDGNLGAGHEMDEVIHNDGKITPSFKSAAAERIVGYIPEKEGAVSLKEIDGTEWVVGKGTIFGWYAPELAERLSGTGHLSETAKKERSMRVSIETLIQKGFVEEDGTEIYEDYTVLGTTILGDSVTEAVTGANIRALSAIGKEELLQMTQLKAASYQQSAKQTKKGAIKTMLNQEEILGAYPEYRILSMLPAAALCLNQDGGLTVLQKEEENGKAVLKEARNTDLHVVCGNAENAVSFAACDLLFSLKKDAEEVLNKLHTAENALQTAENALEKQKKQEAKRRKEAVLSAMDARFSEIKALSENTLDESVLSDLRTDEAINAYAEMENDAGEWIGLNRMQKDVDSVCMSRVLEAKNSENAFFWTDFMQKNEEKDDIQRAIENILK